MSKRGDVWVAVAVLVLMTSALASAAGIGLPAWSTLVRMRPKAVVLPMPDTPSQTKPQPWCNPGTIVGGFCVPKPIKNGTFIPLDGQRL
jgi:hypothetical protein